MKLRKTFFLYINLFLLFHSFNSQAQTARTEETDNIREKIEIIKKYLFENNSWYISNSRFKRDVEDLIYFVEKQNLDSVITKVGDFNYNEAEIISRPPSFFADTLNIKGFIPSDVVRKKVLELRNSVTKEFLKNDLQVPAELLTGMDMKAGIIPQEEGMRLFTDSIYHLPDSLLFLDAIPETMVQTAEDFRRILKLDSIRDAIVEKYRVRFNDSIVSAYRDSVLAGYRNEALEANVEKRIQQYTDSVHRHNQNLIELRNREVTDAVNDTLKNAISVLLQYANSVDTVDISIANLFNESIGLTLGDRYQQYGRLWLKNEQNDSISILVTNPDKRSLKLLLNDNITFSRISQPQSKEIQISNFEHTSGLRNIEKRFKVETPWSIGGDGTVGLTQTYLSNWKKGGQSAVSMLIVLKGFANYSALNNKIKWENSMEIRNGWMKPGGKDENDERYESQKNDDKFELISRFGVSAFKKWYYSAEIDFQTQFFNGYKYPTSVNPEPISAFMAPSKTLFKLGLDYKPNSNLSIFLSPITSKTVFVRDTLKINKSNYNIAAGKRSLWIPGLNAEVKYKTDLTEDISYETKYKMFMNYTKPFERFDVDWENLVVMKVNDYINMRFMLHLIYDDDILFPVYDKEGNETGKKPKLQVKELITVGFSYKINKKVYKARNIN